MVKAKSKVDVHIPMKYVEKGWGYEKWIVNKEEYCGKSPGKTSMFIQD